MTPSFSLKQHNTGPSLRVRLKGADGLVQDLTGATVKFTMSHGKTLAPVITNGSVVVDGDPTLGIVRYDWQPGDTALVGSFLGEFSVTIPNGTVVSFPGNDYIRIAVLAPLA